MATIELQHVYKAYGDGTLAVSDLNLSIAEGEFVVLVGPSGCGKTTALRMVAGLEDISAGTVEIDGSVVNSMAPKDRDVAMVFQNYALYPHLSVRDNIAFGLQLRKVDKKEIARRVAEAAEILGLTEYLDRKPKALSGGQRQRVAMGRAIVREPKAFLMDEPLSNLDAKLRVKMRAEILRLQRSLQVTTIYVTHDQVEAMTMGDRVAVMKSGVLQQVDAPQVLYDHPDNLFVAGFIGSPSMNLFEARLDIDDPRDVSESAAGASVGPRATITFGSRTLELDSSVVESRPALRDYDGRSIVVGLRPEDMEDASVLADSPPGRRLAVRASLVEALGSELLVHVEIDVPPVVNESTRELDPDLDTSVDAELREAESGDATGAAATSEMIARVSPRSQVADGDDIELAVDTTRSHFFDIDSGLAIVDAETARITDHTP